MGSSLFTLLLMPHGEIIPFGRQLSTAGFRSVPALFLDAGPDAWRRFIEFFTAHIRNRNTREAYARAVSRFASWCQERGVQLTDLQPIIVAQYVEELQGVLCAPA